MNITNCIMNIKKSVIGMLLLLGGPSASWAQTDHRFEVMQNLDVFNSIYKQLDMLYVDTLDPKMTIGAGINAMLKSLDPYTEYYPAEKKSDFKMMVTGKYAGIGSLIRYNFALKNVVIEEPYESSGSIPSRVGIRCPFSSSRVLTRSTSPRTTAGSGWQQRAHRKSFASTLRR